MGGGTGEGGGPTTRYYDMNSFGPGTVHTDDGPYDLEPDDIGFEIEDIPKFLWETPPEGLHYYFFEGDNVKLGHNPITRKDTKIVLKMLRNELNHVISRLDDGTLDPDQITETLLIRYATPFVWVMNRFGEEAIVKTAKLVTDDVVSDFMSDVIEHAILTVSHEELSAPSYLAVSEALRLATSSDAHAKGLMLLQTLDEVTSAFVREPSTYLPQLTERYLQMADEIALHNPSWDGFLDPQVVLDHYLADQKLGGPENSALADLAIRIGNADQRRTAYSNTRSTPLVVQGLDDPANDVATSCLVLLIATMKKESLAHRLEIEDAIARRLEALNQTNLFGMYEMWIDHIASQNTLQIIADVSDDPKVLKAATIHFYALPDMYKILETHPPRDLTSPQDHFEAVVLDKLFPNSFPDKERLFAAAVADMILTRTKSHQNFAKALKHVTQVTVPMAQRIYDLDITIEQQDSLEQEFLNRDDPQLRVHIFIAEKTRVYSCQRKLLEVAEETGASAIVFALLENPGLDEKILIGIATGEPGYPRDEGLMRAAISEWRDRIHHDSPGDEGAFELVMAGIGIAT